MPLSKTTAYTAGRQLPLAPFLKMVSNRVRVIYVPVAKAFENQNDDLTTGP